MCGIIGYVGTKQAAPVILDGLARLEYRGYDSAGLAVRDGDADPVIVKAVGRLQNLRDKTDDGRSVHGTCGIGHTRWATHGEPTETNAHPHFSDDMNVIGVHNGIIENYQELKHKLLRHNYKFYSDTDTEVAIKLIDYYYKKYEGTPVDAINHSLVRIRGSYSFAIMFKAYPNEVYVARKDSPMVLGVADDGTYVGSDVTAIMNHTRNVYYIGNMELARMTGDGITFFNLDGDEIQKEMKTVEWDAGAAEKGGFEHFMMKEIHEQPKAVRDTIHAYVKDGAAANSPVLNAMTSLPDTSAHDDVENNGGKDIHAAVEGKYIDLTQLGFDAETLQNLSRIYMIACGSAYHVAMAGKYIFEEITDIPVEVDIASEFRYRNPKLAKNSIVVIISQSGETADSLAALRMAKELGVPTLAIVNVVGSSIAREADHVMYTYAGPEIAVATTKAYSCQLITMYVLAIALGQIRGQITPERVQELLAAMEELPDKIERVIEDKERIQWFAAKFANAHDVFFIGRGIDYAICMEGSLKLKEVSYVHSEAYAAGELKHGTISLIEEGTLVVGVMTQERLFEKTRSNLVEVKSRGAYLMGLTMAGHYNIEDTVDFAVYIPKTEEIFAASLAVVPLQLLGYYVSVARGLDVDKPRNLAKSVTVE